MASADLRERLVEELSGHSAVLDAHVVANDALAVVAAWLRERAEQAHDPDCELGRRELGGRGCAHFDARWRRDFAITLAAEIDGREPQ